MKNYGKAKVHSHEQAFYSGSVEKGLSGLNGNMGFNLWNDLLSPLVNGATAPAIVPSSVIPVVPVNNTAKYLKYGAFAIGGVVLLAMAMKMLSKKS